MGLWVIVNQICLHLGRNHSRRITAGNYPRLIRCGTEQRPARLEREGDSRSRAATGQAEEIGAGADKGAVTFGGNVGTGVGEHVI
jgi:hypothetical protein